MTSLRDFQTKILDGLLENPMVRDEYMVAVTPGIPVGGIKVSVITTHGKPFVLLNQVRAYHRGGGRRAMNFLIKKTDELMLPIELFAVPITAVPGIHYLGKRKLKSWYRGFGFKPKKAWSDHLRREPGASAK